MTKQVFIIRTAPYDYQIDGKNLYQSFNAVAKREIEVSIKPAARDLLGTDLFFDIDSVYCSPRKRSIQTAKLITSHPKVFEELMEIGFKMEDFISEQNFYDKQGNPNVLVARKAFVKALIGSELKESYEEILRRIEFLLKLILEDKSDKVLIFSHGFFMKIIEAYIKDRSIQDNPKNLLKYFDGSSETFKFCEGFILELNDGKFEFNTYIRKTEAE